MAENEYLSSRGGSGWVYPPRDLSPESEGKAKPQGFEAFSPDLSKGVLYEIARSFEGAPAGYPDLYLEDTSDGKLRPLVTEAPSNVAPSAFNMVFAGASSDFEHIVFASDGVLATESSVGAPAGGGLYEWFDGRLRLVNILPDESTEPGAVFGSGEDNYDRAVSSDGSRIFWTDTHAGAHQGDVFVRVDGGRTLEVKDPEHGAFVTASTDGSRVLLSDGHLLNVAGTESVQEADLTGGHGGFQGILGASDDLNSVYFVDTEVLTGPEQNAEGAVAGAGRNNLYLFRGGSVSFIAALSGSDNATGVFYKGDGEEQSREGDWHAGAAERTARVTPDGRFAAFMSTEELVPGAANAGVFEVYEFDEDTGGLVCASCNPTGQRPLGPSGLNVVEPGNGFLPQPLNLSENGRVFFDSYDRLVSQDVNGTEDVYEYEPNGLVSCASSSGCISLISSGQEDVYSSFTTATPSGNDVFFTTASRLVPSEDQDQLVDLYDARVGGSPPPPPPPVPCVEESCKGSSSTPPAGEALASLNITGSGNVLAPLSVPPPAPSSSSKPKSLTRSQLLDRALRACRTGRKSRAKRTACEKHARKTYGKTAQANHKAKKASGRGGGRGGGA